MKRNKKKHTTNILFSIEKEKEKKLPLLIDCDIFFSLYKISLICGNYVKNKILLSYGE